MSSSVSEFEKRAEHILKHASLTQAPKTKAKVVSRMKDLWLIVARPICLGASGKAKRLANL